MVKTSAHRRPNHDMVEEGLNIVPTLNNGVVIFLRIVRNERWLTIYTNKVVSGGLARWTKSSKLAEH